MSFAFVALLQFCLGCYSFAPLSSHIPDSIQPIPPVLWFFLLRFLCHLFHSISYFMVQFRYAGFNDQEPDDVIFLLLAFFFLYLLL